MIGKGSQPVSRADDSAGRDAAPPAPAPGTRGKGQPAATPALQWLRARGIAFVERPYAYVAQGGARHSAEALGVEPARVVKTLIMQDERKRPLVVLMHGDRTVSTRNLARQIGVRSVEPCTPDTAQRHSGYLVGGTSPFGTRREMPVYVERSILALPTICINGGRRGLLVEIEPGPALALLDARPVECALAE